ncbi:MAG: ABC transporter ATP-binding protein [Spirochaetaceae bacterium]|nr:MAG: ABC transporter ATP-binding protein [Spirochaetaceae bacterium]
MRAARPSAKQAASSPSSAALAGAIAVRDLSFSYPSRPEVLQSLSFIVNSGERVAIVGPNGSGKTTLLLLLCGILRPTGGIVSVSDRLIEAGRFNPCISYLFQSPDDQLFSPTVFDDVAFGPLNMGLPADEVRDRVQEALKIVGADALAERPPHHLSGGEKRLVALATVLSMNPHTILLDEPTSNLDSRNRRQVITILQQAPQTLLVTSHDLEFLLEICPRVLLIDGGRMNADGPIRQVLADDCLLQAHGLEKPHSLVPHRHIGTAPHGA